MTLFDLRFDVICITCHLSPFDVIFNVYGDMTHPFLLKIEVFYIM